MKKNLMMLLAGVVFFLAAGNAYASYTSVVNVHVWDKVNPAHDTHYTYLQGLFKTYADAVANSQKNTETAVTLAKIEAEKLLKIPQDAMDYKVKNTASVRDSQEANGDQKIQAPATLPDNDWNPDLGGTFTSIVNVKTWLKSNPEKSTNYVYLQGTFDNQEKALEAAKANTEIAVEEALNEAEILMNTGIENLDHSVTYATSLNELKGLHPVGTVKYKPVVRVTVWIKNCWVPNYVPDPDQTFVKDECADGIFTNLDEAIAAAKNYQLTAVHKALELAAEHFGMNANALQYKVEFTVYTVGGVITPESEKIAAEKSVKFIPVVRVTVWIKNCWVPNYVPDPDQTFVKDECAEGIFTSSDEAIAAARKYQQVAVHNILQLAAEHFGMNANALQYKVEFTVYAVGGVI
ncbi:MAG: hypothetical protein PHW04_16780 [Candidatus Wallbacteria bacterium]|nr:hypothetical protein [Candidatus Wallbacteria bacterium]